MLSKGRLASAATYRLPASLLHYHVFQQLCLQLESACLLPPGMLHLLPALNLKPVSKEKSR